MLTYKTVGGQNIFDVALQTYGNIQYVVKLLQDNPALDINEEIGIGTLIQYEDQVNQLKTFVTNKGINIATNDGANQNGDAFDESFDKTEFK